MSDDAPTLDQILADLDSYPIEGYLPSGRYISIPLLSQIEGDLWMGGCIHGLRLPDDFLTVVSLFSWGRYTLGPDTRFIEQVMYDEARDPDPAVVDALADEVVAALGRGKTLVHCQAGINRSALITASALVKMGRTPEEAIALLREKRDPYVLSNQTFERWLLSR